MLPDGTLLPNVGLDLDNLRARRREGLQRRAREDGMAPLPRRRASLVAQQAFQQGGGFKFRNRQDSYSSHFAQAAHVPRTRTLPLFARGSRPWSPVPKKDQPFPPGPGLANLGKKGWSASGAGTRIRTCG
jgi:hypothetical protein